MTRVSKMCIQFNQILSFFVDSLTHRNPKVYYKEAVGAMIVYDVTREKTFQAVTKWKADIDENLSDIPVILLANKCDLLEKDEDLDKNMLDNFCKENGFIGW